MNYAQAYKWLGDEERCGEILASMDWSASGLEFQLAKAVLKDDYDDAVEIMRRIGSDGVVNQADYMDWPLFRRFRKEERFATVFFDIFSTQPIDREEVLAGEKRAKERKFVARLAELWEEVYGPREDESLPKNEP